MNRHTCCNDNSSLSVNRSGNTSENTSANDVKLNKFCSPAADVNHRHSFGNLPHSEIRYSILHIRHIRPVKSGSHVCFAD